MMLGNMYGNYEIIKLCEMVLLKKKNVIMGDLNFPRGQFGY